MALKDSFINLNKALRTTLQNVPAVVDTLIRGFDEIGDAAEEQSTYSTDERVVGKWIDGSDIYEKTFNKSITLGVQEWTNTSETIENIKQLISVDAYYSNSGAYWCVSGRVLNNTVELLSFRSSGTPITDFTVRYTKTTANRAPENGTRNGGDVVKTTYDPVEDPAADPADNELKK